MAQALLEAQKREEQEQEQGKLLVHAQEDDDNFDGFDAVHEATEATDPLEKQNTTTEVHIHLERRALLN